MVRAREICCAWDITYYCHGGVTRTLFIYYICIFKRRKKKNIYISHKWYNNKYMKKKIYKNKVKNWATCVLFGDHWSVLGSARSGSSGHKCDQANDKTPSFLCQSLVFFKLLLYYKYWLVQRCQSTIRYIYIYIYCIKKLACVCIFPSKNNSLLHINI